MAGDLKYGEVWEMREISLCDPLRGAAREDTLGNDKEAEPGGRGAWWPGAVSPSQ